MLKLMKQTRDRQLLTQTHQGVSLNSFFLLKPAGKHVVQFNTIQFHFIYIVPEQENSLKALYRAQFTYHCLLFVPSLLPSLKTTGKDAMF